MPELMRAVLKAEAAPGAVLVASPHSHAAARTISWCGCAPPACAAPICTSTTGIPGRSRASTRPMVFGHECCGEVVEVGATSSDWRRPAISSRWKATSPAAIACNAAPARAMSAPTCRSSAWTARACYAEYVAVPAKVAWKNPARYAGRGRLDPGAVRQRGPHRVLLRIPTQARRGDRLRPDRAVGRRHRQGRGRGGGLRGRYQPHAPGAWPPNWAPR